MRSVLLLTLLSMLTAVSPPPTLPDYYKPEELAPVVVACRVAPTEEDKGKTATVRCLALAHGPGTLLAESSVKLPVKLGTVPRDELEIALTAAMLSLVEPFARTPTAI